MDETAKTLLGETFWKNDPQPNSKLGTQNLTYPDLQVGRQKDKERRNFLIFDKDYKYRQVAKCVKYWKFNTDKTYLSKSNCLTFPLIWIEAALAVEAHFSGS